MANKYLLKPILKTVKEGFTLEDENNNVVYKAQMVKFSLFGASPFLFQNSITSVDEEHKIGKTVTVDEGGNNLISAMSRRSYFKYDNQNIWDYLHDKGIRIDSKLSNNKIGMTYEISFEGKKIATIATSSPKGKSLITTGLYYEISCEEKDIELVFLVAFSIAKTEQTFYN